MRTETQINDIKSRIIDPYSINNFLSEGNKEQAIEFITYMRTRDLTFERSKWTKK